MCNHPQNNFVRLMSSRSANTEFSDDHSVLGYYLGKRERERECMCVCAKTLLASQVMDAKDIKSKTLLNQMDWKILWK